MENHTEITEKSISDQLSEVWSQLSRNQRRYVVAAQEFATKKEAAESIGLEADTVYRWPKIVDEAVELFSSDVKAAALEIILCSAGKAAMIKVAGLDSDDVRIRQAAASEILDRVLGRPTQPSRAENLNVDLTQLTNDQLERIASGEDPLAVLATSGGGGAGAAQAGEA